MIPNPKHRPAFAVGLLAILGTGAIFTIGAIAATGGATTLPGANIARFIFGTLAAIALLLVTARYLPRLGGSSGVRSEAFRVVATLPVGQRERVVVVQVGDRQVMLGVAPGRVDMVHELAEPLPEAARSPAPRRVPISEAWLSRVLGKVS